MVIAVLIDCFHHAQDLAHITYVDCQGWARLEPGEDMPDVVYLQPAAR